MIDRMRLLSRTVGLHLVLLPILVLAQQNASSESGSSAQQEERRVVAEENRVQIDREALEQKKRSDWFTAIASIVPLVAIAFGVYQINRNLRGQAVMKVLDFADSGYDDEDMLRRAMLASEVLKHELPPRFSDVLRARKPERKHLPFEVVQHRSGLIQMLVNATPQDRIILIRYWNACFNDFKADKSNHWFTRIAQEAGVDIQTLPDFNRISSGQVSS